MSAVVVDDDALVKVDVPLPEGVGIVLDAVEMSLDELSEYEEFVFVVVVVVAAACVLDVDVIYVVVDDTSTGMRSLGSEALADMETDMDSEA